MEYGGLALGIVVASYPQGQSVDVLMIDDGSRLSNVQVAVFTGSDSSGTVDLPDIGGPTDDTRWDIKANRSLYVRAIVAFLRGAPIVIGFLLPQITQMTFDQKNRRIMRHVSDVYSTIDASGNTEVYHPSGTYFRIGTNPAHEDLVGNDFDGKWKVRNNTSAAVHVHLSVANGGSEVASLNIDPSGNVTLTHSGSLTVNTAGTANVTVTGNATVKSPAVKIDAPETTCTGNLTVNGGLNVQGGGSGGTSKINGTMQITGPQLTHNGKDVGSTHEHSGVQTGSSNTGVPV